jgi:heavy metal efflux system protein
MFEKIILFSIRNKLIIGIAIIGLIAWGGYSLTKLPIDAIPDVTNNQVVILTQTPSLATEEVEQYITAPIELQMANLDGVKEIRSISRQGLSVITVVFDEEVGMYLSRQMVAEQIKMAEADIPAGMGTPELAPITTGLGEIYQYTLVPQKGYEDKYSLTDLRTIQDWIVKRQLAGIDGVIEISSFGGYVKQYEVQILPERLLANGVSISELYDAIKANNSNMGGSYIEKNNQAYFIRGEGVLKTLDEIGDVMVKNVNGTPLLVKDLAKVDYGHAIRFGAMTLNGESEAVGAVVLMLKGADSEETIKNVKERVARISETLPEGLEISVFIDRTKLIDKSIKTVTTNLIEGGLIVIFVLVLLLGSIRAGLLVASVIPITMLITFSLMRIVGISANLMSLGAIDFGLLVDCSVIVVEAVLFKLHHDKVFKVPLIPKLKMDNLVGSSAASVLNSAVFGGFIILLVYLPILSLVGIEGKMFRPMALTVSIAILVAIILSLTYIPMAASLFLRKEGGKHFAFSDKLVNKLFSIYKPMIDTALNHTKLVVGMALVLLVSAVFVFSRLGGEFIPTLEEGDIAVDFQTPSGSSLQTTIDASLRAQKALIKHFPEIKQVVGRIGSSEVPTDPMPPEMADLMINLKDKSEWTSGGSREELSEKMAAVLAEEVPGTFIEFTQPIQMRFNEMIAGARSEIVVKIFGEDLNVLAAQGELVSNSIKNLDGVASVKIERVAGLPQISVDYQRNKMALYGLHIDDLNTLLNTAFSGQNAGVIFENEKRFDLVLRLSKDYRQDIENVRALPVKLANGSFIRLADVADITYKTGPAQISREGTKRRINVGIGVMNRDVESLVAEIQSKLSTEVNLPSGYYFEYGGAFENLQNAKKRLYVAVPVALLLIFVMLFFTFHSLRQSLMIFTAIPLAAIGGIFALWFRDMPFSISAGVGFIALFGVAVLNGIVLIGYLNELEKTTDLGIIERVKEAVKVRFRPVIMTALVASLGFLPMAISTSAGAEVQKPLATVVIGGLITATFLTLIVLPILYVLFTEKKMKKSIAALVLLIAFFQINTANAQIGVNELTQIAEVNNPSLDVFKSKVALSEMQSKTVIKKPNTQFHMQYGNIQNVGKGDYVLGAEQTFLNPAKSKSLVELYDAQIGERKAESGMFTAMLFREVRRIFYELQFIDGQKSLLINQKDIFTELLSYASARVNAGETDATEKLLVEAQLLKLYNQERNLNAEYISRLAQLEAYINTSEPMNFSFEKNFFTEDILVNENQELNYLDQLSNSALKEIGVQQSNLKPDFSIGLYNQSMLGNLRQFYVSAGIGIPIFKEPIRQKVNAAKLNQQIILAEKDSKEKILDAQMKALIAQSLNLKRSIVHYQDKALPETSELIEKAKLRYLASEMTFLELHQTLIIKTNLEEELEKSWYQYHLNLTERLWLQGK